MSIDPKEALSLAFQHLNTFSLPGIGTFARRREPAKVDRASGKVSPPVERFHLEPGEGHTEAITDFFFRRYKLTIGKAEELVREAAAALAAAAEGKGLRISGIGLIVRDGDSFRLEPEALTGQDDLFGLSELDFKLAKDFKPDEEAKKKAASLEIEQRKAPEHLITKKRKKKRPVWPFVIIFLLIGLGVGGYLYRNEIRTWFGMDSGITVASADTDSSDTDVDTTGHIAMTDPVDTTAATDLIEEPVMDSDPVEPVVTDTDSDTDADIGVYPKKGRFYLVIASGRNPGAVKEGARRNKAKILRPYRKGNYYRLSVYDDSSKDKVIAKMVELEDKYPKSWIYYLGM